MNASFWQRIHGGSTHFPIVLVLAAVVFDFVAWRSRDEALRRGLNAAGFGSAVVGMLGGIGAVMAGLIMTRGQMLGSGYEKTHHLFVGPRLVRVSFWSDGGCFGAGEFRRLVLASTSPEWALLPR